MERDHGNLMRVLFIIPFGQEKEMFFLKFCDKLRRDYDISCIIRTVRRLNFEETDELKNDLAVDGTIELQKPRFIVCFGLGKDVAKFLRYRSGIPVISVSNGKRRKFHRALSCVSNFSGELRALAETVDVA